MWYPYVFFRSKLMKPWFMGFHLFWYTVGPHYWASLSVTLDRFSASFPLNSKYSSLILFTSFSLISRFIKMCLTSKISHYCMSVLIQQDIVAAKIKCSARNGSPNMLFQPINTPPQQKKQQPKNRKQQKTHLLRSLWMMGWVRLCRYSIPLATSMAMMSLDCRSISLSIDTSLKQQPLTAGSMVPANHTRCFTQINREVYKDGTWSHS